MSTVDCNDVLPIQHELLIYISDQLGAVPALKHHKFILSPIEQDDKIDQEEVSIYIKEYLDSIGEENNFNVIANSNTILIKSINGKKINKIIQPVKTLRTCCGF